MCVIFTYMSKLNNLYFKFMNKKTTTLFVLLIVTLSPLFAQIKAIEPSLADKKKISESIANIPVSFRQNMGQWDEKILFQGNSPAWGATISFLHDGLSFGFCRNEKEKPVTGKVPEQSLHDYLVWNLHFKNNNADVKVSAEGKEDSHANYLLGKDASKHKTNVPDYRVIKYNNIYNNIDIKYYSNGKNLEYDFILKPNADVTQIQMECEGIKNLDVNEKGQLEITTEWGTLLEEIPESYQLIHGEKKLVKITYKKINSTTFGFDVEGAYNHEMDLVIDPINLAWSTFVGGAGGDGYISDITVDNAGNVYGTGWYNSAFPTTAGSYQQGYRGGGGYGDAYIFKLNATASAYVYATYLGGFTSYEQGEGIAVNAAGEVYLCGWTQSTDFPTTAGAYNTTFTGTSFQDIFITKLNAAGSALVYSNLIGGIYSDYAYAIALDAAGAVYITGYSTNNNLDFPTTGGAYQSAATGAGVYVLKMNAAGSALVFSTFTQNSGTAYGIAIDAAGNSYVTGDIYATTMTVTPGAFQAVAGANTGLYSDMFVQKINPTGTNLVYSTYLGGGGQDDINYGDGIAVDAAGNAYITGGTGSSNFPTTAGAFDVTWSGQGDPFLTKLNPTGTGLVYSTFIGQGGVGESVAINSSGEAFVVGNIGDTLGLVTSPCTFDATQNGGTDCFLVKMDATGSTQLYASYFGGTGNDYGNGPFGKVKVVLWGPCQDEVYVSTTSHSPDFPTTAGTVQPVKLNSGADQPVVFHLKPKVTPSFSFAVNCNVVNFTDLSNGTCIWKPGPWTPTAWTWHFGDGNSATTQNPSHSYSAPGTYTVTLIVSCPRDSIKIPVTVSPGLVLSMASTNSGCSGSTGSATVSVTSGTGPFTYTWTATGGNAATASNLAPGHYTVTVSNGSCTNKDTVTIGSAGTPPVTSAITGPSPVCPNATGIIYSVINTAGSTYNWAVPAGATITTGQGTNSITVNWGATGGTITCTEINPCGTGTPVTTNVTISTTPVTSAISGTTSVCPNATNTTYSVVNTTGSTYNWSVPAGATIISGQGTNSIVVNWGTSGGTVSVTETSTCGTGTPVTTNVVMGSTPTSSAITGTSPICPNATNTTYSVTNNAGSTYNWTVPATATITAGQTTDAVTVNWGAGGGVVSCTETNACGNGTPVTYTVIMNSIPVTPAITGPTNLCANTSANTYSVTNAPGSIYTWTVTGGGTISFGQGSNSIFVNWATTGGTVSVSQANACGTGVAVTTTVMIVSPPVTSTISGPTPLCPNATNTTYSVTNTTGSTYSWSVPATATITAGQTTNAINVNWASAGGVITCTETNACGNGTPVTYTVIMNAAPATGNISGTTPVCPHQTNVIYTVNNTAGSTYTWTVPAGTNITFGQNSNSIIVTWGTVAGNVSVIESNSCGTGTAVVYPVAVSTLAITSPITGGNPSCANTNGVTYFVTAGGTSYTWTVNGGGTIANGQGTNSIHINWGATGGVVTCTEYNQCGAGNTVMDSVTFLNIPITTNITGISPVCPNQNGAAYSVTTHSTSTYSWTVSGGGTIASGQNTNSILANWGASGGVVTCTESNMCGSGAPASFTVNMNSLPVTGTITGPSPVCGNAANTIYYVNNTIGDTYNWTTPIGATIIAGQGTDSITVDWTGSAGGNINVVETNACGHGAAVTLPVTVNAAPTVQISANQNQGCSPLQVKFTDNTVLGAGVTITSWSWLFGDGNISSIKNPTNVYYNPGGYNVSLTITTNAGCTSTFSDINYINVYPNPVASFTTTESAIYISDPVVHFTDESTVTIATWSWNFGDTKTSTLQNPTHSYNDAGLFDVMLAVSNQYGCVDTVRKTITIKEEFAFYVPNAFTPNGDGKNETFSGVGTDIGDYEMLIFDRWGELIYKTNDYNQPWDGKMKHKGDILLEDVYVYRISVSEQENKKQHTYQGNVTLVK
jgi:gliding motility-associated-like protein